MVSVVDLAGLGVLLVVNGAVASLLTRFFRVRLRTRWGPLVYALILVPVVLVGVTLILGSVLGPNLGSPAAVLGVTVLLPLGAGIAFDYFWMPAPEDVELPAEHRR